MTLNEYQFSAGETDMITEAQFKMGYYPLGMCGESAEVYTELLKLKVTPSSENIEAMALEVSDVCWYAARYIFRLKGLKSIGKAYIRDKDGSISAVNAGLGGIELSEDTGCTPNLEKLQINCMQLSIKTGTIADIVKKVIRDQNGAYSQDKVNEIALLCEEVLKICWNICNNLGISFNKCLEMNLAKLASRKARGVIGGNGSFR